MQHVKHIVIITTEKKFIYIILCTEVLIIREKNMRN